VTVRYIVNDVDQAIAFAQAAMAPAEHDSSASAV
jgi:hypothetical protein